MTGAQIQFLAAVLAALAVAAGIISFDSRIKLLALASQYTAAAFLANQVITSPVLVAKAAVGASVVLGLILTSYHSRIHSDSARMSALPASLPFRVVLALFGLLAGLGLAARGWLPIPDLVGAPAAVASMLIVGGFIQVGLMQVGFGAGIGLLMALTGFDLALSHVERSLAVAALFSLTHIGLGVAAGYLKLHQTWRISESGRSS